jgi:hypothetical protein
MIEIKIEASNPAELREYCAMLGGLAGGCCVEKQPTPRLVDADTFRDALDRQHERKQEVSAKLFDAGEEEAPAAEPEPKKTRRSRKKKTEAAKVEEPAKEEAAPAAEEPTAKADEPVKEEAATETVVDGEAKLGLTEVRAACVRFRDKMGVEKLRELLAKLGGKLDDIDPSKYPEVMRKVEEFAT